MLASKGWLQCVKLLCKPLRVLSALHSLESSNIESLSSTCRISLRIRNNLLNRTMSNTMHQEGMIIPVDLRMEDGQEVIPRLNRLAEAGDELPNGRVHQCDSFGGYGLRSHDLPRTVRRYVAFTQQLVIWL